MKEILVDGRKIGSGRTFIIAEVGSNYDCSIDVAKKLIDKAVEAGADAVKFQTFRAKKLITANVLKPAYQDKGSTDRETYQESLKKFEISEEEHVELKKYCDDKGIIFMSTPHAQNESINLLERVGVSSYKIASGDLTNFSFLEYAAKTGKPIFLSTGMANISEINDAVSIIKKAGNDKIVVLQCTSAYPCKPENINLRAMETIRTECDVLVGLSEHTTTISVPTAAVALGAVVLEKHFTLGRNRKGPDHQASLNPDELKKMVRFVREVEKALGSPEKRMLSCEEALAKIIRKSVIAAREIKAGETILAEMLEVKRPGTGLLPKDIVKVIGKRARKNIAADSLISFEDFD